VTVVTGFADSLYRKSVVSSKELENIVTSVTEIAVFCAGGSVLHLHLPGGSQAAFSKI
jgi:hypothetical protein